MEQGTPIHQLGNINNSENIDNTVDDIINQINSDGDPPMNMNYEQPQQQQQHQQQQQQQQEHIPQDIPQQQFQPMMEQQMNPSTQQQYVTPPVIGQENIIDTSNLDTNLSSLTDKIVSSIKHPLIIMVLYNLLNIKQVDNIFKYKNIKFLIDEDGQLTFASVVIKSILLALLFYVIKMFV